MILPMVKVRSIVLFLSIHLMRPNWIKVTVRARQLADENFSPSARRVSPIRICVLYIFLILQFSSLPFSKVRAENFAAPVPSGQAVLSAQTVRDNAGACFQGTGRAFFLAYSSAFTTDPVVLSGLGIYVTTRVDRYGSLNPNDFSLSLRQGLEPNPQDSSNLLFANLHPSSVTSVDSYDDGMTKSQTLLVAFTFPTPLTLKRPTTATEMTASYHTAYLTCAVAEANPSRYILRETGSYRYGMYRLFNETTQSYGASNSLALNLLLFTPASSSSSSSSSSSDSVYPSSVLRPPSFRPLILIHGLGGKPEDWLNGRTNYQTYLRSLGYPDDYVHYYSYGYDSQGNYNYQGDIRVIATGLEDVVNRLSDKYKADGGDGKVDLLGFSLGGVVARQYLSSHLTNHKVHKLITIGSPHQGSWVLSADDGIYSFPVLGPSVEKIIANFVLKAVNQGKVQTLDKNAVAVKEIYPNSEFLVGYYGINNHVPQDVEYATFYGDIHASVQRKLFSSVIEKRVSIGDGLILPESAYGIPSVSTEKHAYSENAVIPLKLEKLGNSYAVSVDLPNSGLLKAFHTYLLDRNDLQKDLACSALGKKDANLCK